MTTELLEIIPLEVSTKGEIRIDSNLELFRESVDRFVAAINRDLKTDADFGQATLDVKCLQSINDAIKDKKAEIIAQAESVQAILAGLDDADESISKARLDLSKQIKAKADEIKTSIIEDAIETLQCSERLRSRYRHTVTESIKGKRTLDTMRAAASTMVANLNAGILKSREVIQSFTKTHGADLVPDAEDLEIETLDKVCGELRRRYEARQHREEAARLKKEKEEAIKAAEAAKAQAVANRPATTPQGQRDAPWSKPATDTPKSDDPAEEWKGYVAKIREAGAILKAARAGLWHEQNVKAAARLAERMNQAVTEACNIAAGKEEA